MEQFRNALRFAVQHNARRMTLTSSETPKVLLSQQETSANEIGSFDYQTMVSIRDFLFPNHQATTDLNARTQIHEGTLQVPQIGTLMILSEWSDQTVTCAFYLPGNQELYASDLAKGSLTLNSKHPLGSPSFSPQSTSLPLAPTATQQLSTPLPPTVRVTPPLPTIATASATATVSGNDRSSPFPVVSGDAPVDMFKISRSSENSLSSSIPSIASELPSIAELPQINSPIPIVSSDSNTKAQTSNSSRNSPPNLSGSAAPSLFASLAKEDPMYDQQDVPSVFSPPPADEIQVIQPFQIVTEEPLSVPSSNRADSSFTIPEPVKIGLPMNPVQIQPNSMMPPPVISTPQEDSTIHFGGLPSQKGSVSSGSNPIDNYLKEMVQAKASDIHLTVGQPIIFRKSGDVERVGNEMLTPELMESLLLPTFPTTNKADFAKNNDTDFAYELKGVGRFRVNVFRNRMGVAAVLRHIPATIISSETLNLPPAVMNFCKLNKGLVLVTGPTGSGKSTTLAAMLDWINRNRKEHILTIEDPIEFVHEQKECLINQREVHKHTTSFARALKAALREDPDIILIGEMRDLETIAIAIETAETGHLVFGTLHTTTAISTVDRIIDQFPADRQSQIRAMLSSSLRGVITQTLLKKKTGGRIAAQEILVSDTAVAAMIREGKNKMIENHMLTQKAEGNQSLNDVLIKYIQDGIVDAQEAYFKSVDKQSFLFMCEKKGIKIEK
jgi:twitching motility protein PilT